MIVPNPISMFFDKYIGAFKIGLLVAIFAVSIGTVFIVKSKLDYYSGLEKKITTLEEKADDLDKRTKFLENEKKAAEIADAGLNRDTIKIELRDRRLQDVVDRSPTSEADPSTKETVAVIMSGKDK